MEPEKENLEVQKHNGPKNLIILGIFAITVSVATSLVSLYVYHASGDIYLDRSRPGFLPDKTEETRNHTDNDYVFPDSGDLSDKTLDEYLKHLRSEIKRINIDQPFGQDAISDETLGI